MLKLCANTTPLYIKDPQVLVSAGSGTSPPWIPKVDYVSEMENDVL